MNPAANPAEAIDALLPQTQCTRCGYDGCRPYAEAIVSGDADINQCPPGGAALVAELARLLGRASKPLDPRFGVEGPARVALIDEQRCIGCFKCVQACPVDAIVGAPRQMHTVLAAECSGCELCIPPCPVDCIVLAPRAEALPSAAAQAGLWRRRHGARKERLAREQQARAEARRRRPPSLKEQAQDFDIAAALARVKARKDAQNR